MSYRFDVDPREVKARLDLPVVRAIIENGTPVHLVRKAIERRLTNFGDDFSSAQNLLKAVFEIENEDDLEDQITDNIDNLTTFDYVPGAESSESRDPTEADLSPEWTCKICLDAEVKMVFLPCAHLVTCNRCAARLRTCPICRTRIQKSIKASYS